VGSGWSVGESPVRSAQVPSVTGPWPWPWQRFASSARSSTPRLVQRGRSARPGHRPGCLCVEPCAMDASTAALAPSLTVVDRRPSPATVSLENLSPTRCFYAPCLLAPQRARRARPAAWPCAVIVAVAAACPSGTSPQRPWMFLCRALPSDKHPGSDLNWAFVSAAGGRLIRSGMAQAGPSQPSARGKALCSKSRRIVAPCCNDRQERSLWRQAFPRRHWLDRCETRAKHAGNRQPAPASANLHQQSLSGPDCCRHIRHIQHLTPNTWSPSTWCPRAASGSSRCR
jgi:hypothetical protein